MEILVTSSLAIGAAQTPGSGETESMGSPREGQKPDRKEGLPGSVLNLGIGQKKKSLVSSLIPLWPLGNSTPSL